MYGTSYTTPLPKWPIKWPQSGDLISYRAKDGYCYAFVVLDFSHKTLEIILILYQRSGGGVDTNHLVLNYNELTAESISALELAVTLYGH